MEIGYKTSKKVAARDRFSDWKFCDEDSIRRIVGDGRSEGFDYPDCEPFLGDSLRHEVRWQGRGLEALKDRVIRIEFCLKGAELYTFLASA